MHCGGIPFNGDTVATSSLGGSESAAYYLARELSARGHKVVMFTNHTEEGVWDGVKYLYAGAQDLAAGFPLGPRFDFYARYTPHDVLIVQRHPLAYMKKYASKVNMLWLHDIGLIRNKEPFTATTWQIDRIMTVSKYHKNQIIKAWGVDKEIVIPIINAVDDDLYENDEREDLTISHPPGEERYKLRGMVDDKFGYFEDELNLLYQSRPERGLENLVKPEGIMDQLLKRRPDAHLYVCNYDHDVPQMKAYYQDLFARVHELPNCTELGCLPKATLAQVQQNVDALVYPTEFQEVSCITAIEAMKAGLPAIVSKFAALPETCKDSGTILVKMKDGAVSPGRFVDKIESFDKTSGNYADLVDKQLKAGLKYTWVAATDRVEKIIKEVFDEIGKNPITIARDLSRNSDIVALDRFLGDHLRVSDPILANLLERELPLYKYAQNSKAFKKHYDDFLDGWYDTEFDRKKENPVETTRYRAVVHQILTRLEEGTLPQDAMVLDYGCAHGHYTNALAERFTGMQFVGIDVSERAIEEAGKWAQDKKLSNVSFLVGDLLDENPYFLIEGADATIRVPDEDYNEVFDLVIAAEVLEHVWDPGELLDSLRMLAKVDAWMILTTPFGPWEEISYRKDHPWRHHLHHYERGDLRDLVGGNEGYGINAVFCGFAPTGEVLGQYVTRFKVPPEGTYMVHPIDYERKFREYYPRGTVSACLIVKDGERSLRRCLDSIAPFVDEVIIGVDEKTADRTAEVISAFAEDNPVWPFVRSFDITSPLDQGFDAARNETLELANGDWILWLDADEECVLAQELSKLLRINQFNGYPLRQHHFSIDPDKVLTVDFPVRLFRNHRGIRFFGVVHEHPETELNKGVGPVWIQPHPSFGHQGYLTEDIRRGRFQRNITLLKRDREKYPDRILGKFLWVRDLAQLSGFEMETNGGQITPEMVERAKEGIQIWEEALDSLQDPTPMRPILLRMLIDFTEYYSMLCHILGEGFDAAVKIGVNKMDGKIDLDNAKAITGMFAKREHLQKLLNAILEEGTKDYEETNF